jgi:hypothetical protein
MLRHREDGGGEVAAFYAQTPLDFFVKHDYIPDLNSRSAAVRRDILPAALWYSGMSGHPLELSLNMTRIRWHVLRV